MLLVWFIFVAAFNFSSVDLLSKPLSRRKRSDEFIPCDEGWLLFREKCLKFRGEKTEHRGNWDRAETNCKNDGGNLVTIQSKEELDFIIHFMLLEASTGAWIGLRKRGNSTQWTDGSAVNFTFWNEGQPSNQDDEDCVVMKFVAATDTIGQWDDVRCGGWNAYICEKKINRRKKSQNPQFCATQQGGGWKFQNTCYHVVMEMKTWENAEQHCKDNYGGHLATVLDKGVDLYLDTLLSSINKQFWIGMKISDGSQQKWASGWFVTYNRTSTHYEEVVDDTCVLRNNSAVWNMAPCSKKHPFICDTFRDPPVLKQPANGSHCPDIPSDWIDLGGEYCYFFETSKSANWYEASFECKRRGGNLASIHSKEESELMQPFVKYVTAYGLYIGLLRQLVREDMFVWSDGSPLDYQHWSYYEPSGAAEQCGEVWTVIMDWNDVWCSEKRPYICSVKKVAPNVTKTIETIQCPSPIPYTVLIGVAVCIILVLILLGVVVYCLRSKDAERRKESTAAALSQNVLSTYRLKYRSQVQEIKVKEEEPREAPQYEEPQYEEPQYQEPTYEEPTYEESTYEDSLYKSMS